MDSLSVPPDLAEKGTAGKVMAGGVVDRIDDMLTRDLIDRLGIYAR